MSNSALKKLIRELVEEELAEISTTANAGPYMTKFAFRGNSAEGKAKAKKIASQAGYEPIEKKPEVADKEGDPEERVVSYGEKGKGALKKPKKEEIVQENRYTELKGAEGTPTRKIAEAVREINRQISEIDRIVSLNARLKRESGLDGSNLYKNTVKSITRLESKLQNLSIKLRELKA